MKFEVVHQESYSRGELLLRSFFGAIYIGIPHGFMLALFSIWSNILTFISFWAILFTGRYPQSFFEFQEAYFRWNLRVNARLMNLSDGYPEFFNSGTDDRTTFEMPYPENLSRGMAIVKLLFGWLYCALPHVFVLLFRMIWNQILLFIAWWVVLFTGKFPTSTHEFTVGTLRWGQRITNYLSYLSDDYPPFSGRPDDDPPSSGDTASGETAATPDPDPAPASDPAPPSETGSPQNPAT